LRDGLNADQRELRDFLRSPIAGYKTPECILSTSPHKKPTEGSGSFRIGDNPTGSQIHPSVKARVSPSLKSITDIL
jgi:hypothetical protein